MAKNLKKLLEAALNGKMSEKHRRTLAQRFGVRWVLIPSLFDICIILMSSIVIEQVIAHLFGDKAALVAMLVLVVLAAFGVGWFLRWRLRRVVPRIMAHLETQGIRPHLCLKCEYDLKGSTALECPECGTGLAPVMDDGMD